MSVTFTTGVYAALLTALSASQVPTELSVTGYARQAVSTSYDPIANQVTILNGFTFSNTSAGIATAAVAIGFFDASSGGNLLFSYPIASTAIGIGASVSYPANETFGPLSIVGSSLPANPNGSIAQGASMGLISGQPVTAGVNLTMTNGAIAASGNASYTWNSNPAPSTNLAAAGSTQGGAALITARRTIVTVTASTEGVRLPFVGTGAEFSINVPGTKGVKVYPPLHGTLSSAASNVAILLVAGKGVVYEQTTATAFITKLKGA